MKRAFHILFAFYFLLLLVMPCADHKQENYTNTTEINRHKDEGKHEDENCTPLCVCSCCSTLVVIKDATSPVKQIEVVKMCYTFCPEKETTSAPTPVWQPPRFIS